MRKIEVNNIGEYLRLNGVKPSYQRIKVFQYFLENHNHPTVDMIYKSLCPEIPTLSKTTVYNTLNLFIEKKIASILIIEENETRYDLINEIHGHFKCTCCNEIYDVELNQNVFLCEDLKEHCVEEHHFCFKGICKTCLSKKN